MSDRSLPIWTIDTIYAYAALHRLDIPSQIFAQRLLTMAQKATDTGATISRDLNREDQPAFSFTPGSRSV